MAYYITHPKEYQAWAQMKLRCSVKSIPMEYSWNWFESFLKDVGTAPSHQHKLMCRNKSDGYTKGNVLWSLPFIPDGIDTDSREYRIWVGMRQRCYNPRNKDYPRYGGRGITIEERWLRSFYAFYHDMGPCPDGFSIERKDVNGGYTADNCIWASDDTQRNNKTTTHWVNEDDGRLSLRQWCSKHSQDYKLTHKRLSRGWTLAECRRGYR